MQRYHFFRTDPIPNILRIGRYRSNPIQRSFFFFLSMQNFYTSLLTWSSLFCVLNTIYYRVSQLVGQKCSPKFGCRLYKAKETTSTKNVILNDFLMRDFYFKRRAWKRLTLLSEVKKECLRKMRCPDSEAAVRWDVDSFNVSLIILSLFS